jgi:hypothetical protein
MNANDFDAFAHDLYEHHLYEQIRSQYPDLTPSEVAMRVIGALGLGVEK